MTGKNIVNELENTIIFCIAMLLIAFLFYYVLDHESARAHGFETSAGLYFIRVLTFLAGGAVAALAKFVKARYWDFKLFFWVNVSVVVIVLIININLKLFF